MGASSFSTVSLAYLHTLTNRTVGTFNYEVIYCFKTRPNNAAVSAAERDT